MNQLLLLFGHMVYFLDLIKARLPSMSMLSFDNKQHMKAALAATGAAIGLGLIYRHLKQYVYSFLASPDLSRRRNALDVPGSMAPPSLLTQMNQLLVYSSTFTMQLNGTKVVIENPDPSVHVVFNRRTNRTKLNQTHILADAVGRVPAARRQPQRHEDRVR